MSDAILFNNYALINGNLIDWNIAFNNPDFIDYITTGSVISIYTGYESYIEDYQYESRTYQEMNFPFVYGKIGTGAFKNCLNLEYINFNSTYISTNSAQEMGSRVFEGCRSLKRFYNYLNRHIGEYAFANCSSLETVICGNDTGWYSTNIYSNAFRNCENLVSVLMSNVYMISDYAFYKCHNLLVNFGSNGKFLSSCRAIGEYAFYECSSIQYFSISSYSGTYIGSHAFEKCDNLLSITISHVEVVSDYAFFNNPKLNSINLSFNNNYGSYDGRGIIGSYAFTACPSLSDFVLVGSCIKIYDYAFTNCPLNGNTYTFVVSMVNYIGSHAFESCGLKSAIIGSDYYNSNPSINFALSYIGECAFKDCSSLTSISLNGHYILENKSIFEGCTGLSYFYNLENTSNSYWGDIDIRITSDVFLSAKSTLQAFRYSRANYIGPYAFYNFESLYSIECAAYQVYYDSYSSPLSNYIGSHAFEKCYNLGALYDSFGSLNYVGDRAFAECSLLQNVVLTFNSYSYYFGYDVFSGCDNIAHFYFASAQYIREYIFANHSKLMAGEIYGSACSLIESHAFENCTSLESIRMDSVQHISAYAFANCTALTRIYGANVKDFDSTTFSGCYNVSIYSMSQLAPIKDYYFKNNSNIINLELGGGVIESEAFYNCSHLAYIKFISVSNIGEQAFYGCSGIGRIDFSWLNISSISGRPFSGLNNMTVLYISRGTLDFNEDNYSIFYNISHVGTLSLPSVKFNSITSVFQELPYLMSLNISYILSLSVTPFSGLSGLYNLSIYGDTVTFNDSTYSMLYDMPRLESLRLPGTVFNHISDIFINCSNLTYLYIRNFNTNFSVSCRLFSGLSNLSILNLHSVNWMLKSNNYSMLYDLTNLKTLYIYSIDNRNQISNAFWNLSNLEYLSTNFTYYYLSSSVYIHSNMFSGCVKLSDIRLNNPGVIRLESIDAFDSLPSTYSINVPRSLYSNYISYENWSLISSHIMSV